MSKRPAGGKERPLEVVRVVREQAVDVAARALRDAEASAARARAAEAEASARADKTREQARERTAREVAALGHGASARDLAQLAAFETGNARAIEQAREDARAAAREARASAAGADASRGALAAARTSLEVVEKHQAAARKRREDAAAAQLDEVAEEAYAARRGPRTPT